MWTKAELEIEALKKDFQNLSRAPFIALLARFVGHQPSDEAIQAEAEKYPNRYVQNIQMLMRSAGYRDQTEVSLTMSAKLAAMSDAELAAYVQQLDTLSKSQPKEDGVDTSAGEIS